MESWTLNSGCLHFYLGNIVVTSADLQFVRANHMFTPNFRSKDKYNLTMHMEDGGEPEMYVKNINGVNTSL